MTLEVKKKKATVAQQVRSGKVQKATDKSAQFALGRENYIIMIIGLVFIAVGFLLMIGGNSDDPKVFSDAIFSFRRITLAPILVLAGYVIEIFAIMKKPKDTPQG